MTGPGSQHRHDIPCHGITAEIPAGTQRRAWLVVVEAIGIPWIQDDGGVRADSPRGRLATDRS
ncbi:hypothetical protein [Komagataeibacter saccharivorans]|uniref:hypothetical protein n=1 Tax=Komagataeibacter saccharivorans TaxID=265959 RepID=UPI0024A8FE2F|nr:hypothetical protein [Komagataeibacter saccharivorans]